MSIVKVVRGPNMRVNLSVRKHNVKSVPLEKCINISTFELPQEFAWTRMVFFAHCPNI